MTADANASSESELGFTHRFVPAGDGANANLPLLLLLHGTGGSKDDLLDLGRMLLPGAPLLSPRGNVSEHGAARYFRRLAEGVFDVDDLIARTHELAGFIDRAARHYGVAGRHIIAVGYSNGANIASSVMLLHPGLLAGGILLRPMVPFVPDTPPDLNGTAVLLSAGRMDPIVPQDNTQQLADLLASYGADVSLRWQPTGHGLTRQDVVDGQEWLARVLGAEF